MADLLEERSLMVAQRQGGLGLALAGALTMVLGFALAMGMLVYPALMAAILATILPVGCAMMITGSIRRSEATARLREIDAPRAGFPAARLLR
ncbi:MAG: hypothetical protein QM831_02905 [Kofleriaceae bacterium]